MKTKIQLAIPSELTAAFDKAAGCFQATTVKSEMGDDGTPELYVLDTIGGDWMSEDPQSTAAGVAAFLRENRGKDVRVMVNSPGGLAFEGLAMYNLLAGHDGNVTTRNIAMAGSAASVLLMAGDTIEMHDNATLFIHRAMGLAIGSSDAMLELAEFLDQLDGQIAGVYAARTGKRKDSMLNVMRGEKKKDGTFLTAAEAKAQGFIDSIIPSKAKEKNARNELITESTVVDPERVRNRLSVLARQEREAAGHCVAPAGEAK